VRQDADWAKGKALEGDENTRAMKKQ
jgi:hypothetical protein